MNTLSTQTIDDFVSKINELAEILQRQQFTNIKERLERFENLLTLQALLDCFNNSSSDDLSARLIDVFAKRWERIRYTSLRYRRQPMNEVNALCLSIANKLVPATTAAQIDALAPKTGPYCLLMPTLESTEDVYGTNIHALNLHEFVLSRNGRTLIPVYQCLVQASESDEGKLRHLMAIAGQYPLLSSDEVQKICRHSGQALAVYNALETYNNQRVMGDGVGAKLTQLASALRAGGAKKGGEELNAGAAANLAISEFYDYWTSLAAPKKAAILKLTPELESTLDRLFRPNDANFKEVRFCVELIANALDPIINIHNGNLSLQQLKANLESKLCVLKEAMENPVTLDFTFHRNAMTGPILGEAYKLPEAEQQAIFAESGAKNALFFALEYSPKDLEFFELDDLAKQEAINARFTARQDPAIFIAAKKGQFRTGIKTLLDWGADIEARDIHGSTALHWAAYNGKPVEAAYLLSRGADINALGDGGNTALMFAIAQNNKSVVTLLLEQNASLVLRNKAGWNALDYAIKRAPQFIEPLLLHIVSLPVDQQELCFFHCSKQSDPQALSYAAVKQPALFQTLVNRVLELDDETLKRDILNASPETLKTAIRNGQNDLVEKLLATKLVDINARDVFGHSALHTAAESNSSLNFNRLVAAGIIVDPLNKSDASLLYLAVNNGNFSMFDQLLDMGAPLTTKRNFDGKNCLDLALERPIDDSSVHAIIKRAVRLSIDDQREFFCRCPGGFSESERFLTPVHNKHEKMLGAVLDLITQDDDPDLSQALLNSINEGVLFPLKTAVRLNLPTAIDTLISRNVNINLQSQNRKTALYSAAEIEREVSRRKSPMLKRATMRSDSEGIFIRLVNKSDNVDDLLSCLGLYTNNVEIIKMIIIRILTLSRQDNSNQADSGHAKTNTQKTSLYENIVDFDKFYAVAVLLQPDFFSSVDETIVTPDHRELTTQLKQMGFDSHLKNIYNHYHIMLVRSERDGDYLPAVASAKALLIACLEQKHALFMSQEGDVSERLKVFKEGCKTAISLARPELKKYRHWGKILAEFLTAVITFPISIPLYAFNLFSIKAKSEQLLDKLDDGLDQADLPKKV